MMTTKTHELEMKELKSRMTSEEILNSKDMSIRSCNFSVQTIREQTRLELNRQGKTWNETQVDILAQGVENSDWLKIHFEIEELIKEVREWIPMLEQEWIDGKYFGY